MVSGNKEGGEGRNWYTRKFEGREEKSYRESISGFLSREKV